MKLFAPSILRYIKTLAAGGALALAAVLAAPSGSAQVVSDPPDMAKIKAEVTNPSSRYYYPKLFEKYSRNDTLMNLEEYRYLYLGTIYQEDFNPYRRQTGVPDYNSSPLYQNHKFTRTDYDSIIKYAEIALANDPFDLRQMSFLIYALNGRQKVNLAKIWQYRLNHLLAAILSTGTGASPENAWVVINLCHIGDIMYLRGLPINDARVVDDFYEYIELKDPIGKGDNKVEGYYFNMKYFLDEYNRKFGSKQ